MPICFASRPETGIQADMTNNSTRRDFLAASAAVLTAQTVALEAPANAARPSQLPFLWGAATSGHLVEGNNTNSDIWFLENIRPTKFGVRSGDACDSYHRYEEDIHSLKSFGLNCYRFSVEWARIEPSPGAFSNAELSYYKRVIDTCHKYDVHPIVSFNHFSCPQWFSSSGGWTKPESADLFARYCDQTARHLAEGIHMATTLNEPQVKRIQHWLPNFTTSASLSILERHREAARAASGSPEYMAFHLADDDIVLPNLIKAHEVGYAAIKSVAPKLPVGVSLAIIDYQAEGPQSRLSEVRDYVNGAWLKAAADTCDFVGVQNYGRDLIGAAGVLPTPPAVERNMLTQQYYPAALGNVVKYVHEATGKPILVSENGIATRDDTQRIRYIDDALIGLRSVMNEGVPVLGYIHWSLLDNFEWSLGFAPTFGLVAVDRGTFQRTPKPSARHLGQKAHEWK
jgi:beta-glucosidase